MKEIVIISGKGGTGKTSITASFGFLEGKKAVVADCDVDAANMHLLMKPDFAEKEKFFSGVFAEIDTEKCIKCGKCMENCHFDAINNHDDFEVIKLDCEGCGFCARLCPVNAINMKDQEVGFWYSSTIKNNAHMVHARLDIGAENSGKLVAKVKREAKDFATQNNIELIIVDGAPGIGCPVVSSLSGADFVVFVTEPSVSGIHDLKRVNQLVEKFKIPAGCIINKADLNLNKTEEILKFLEESKIQLIGKIPYSEKFTKAMVSGKTIVESEDEELKKLVRDLWEKTKLIVNQTM